MKFLTGILVFVHIFSLGETIFRLTVPIPTPGIGVHRDLRSSKRSEVPIARLSQRLGAPAVLTLEQGPLSLNIVIFIPSSL